MSKKKVLFMNTFVGYSKDEDPNRRIEDFESLRNIVNVDLNKRLDILLSGYKLKEMFNISDDEYVSVNRGEHGKKYCKGFPNSRKNDQEKRICKCMFYYDRQTENEKKTYCEGCINNHKWTNDSNRFMVVDYELPMPYKYKVMKNRNVDLVIKDSENGNLYAVEVKDWDSDETLSRMIAEIFTYTSILQTAGEYGQIAGKDLLPAIAFFDGSLQHKMYKQYKDDLMQDFMEVLKKLNVFIIRTSNSENKVCEFSFDLEDFNSSETEK